MNDRLARGYVIVTLAAGTAFASGAGAFQLLREAWRIGIRGGGEYVSVGVVLVVLSLVTAAGTVVGVWKMLPKGNRSRAIETIENSATGFGKAHGILAARRRAPYRSNR